jgi:hypothetical protein
MGERHSNPGALIIKGLQEAIAHMRGERPDLRTVRYVKGEDGSVEGIEAHCGRLPREVMHPRAGWDEAFRRLADERADDDPLDAAASSSSWDDREWEWPS